MNLIKKWPRLARRALPPYTVWGDQTTHAGCMCENVVFVFFLSRSDPTGCTFEGVHSSSDHCVAVYGPILMRFSTFFSREPFQQRHTVLIFVARWCHIIREIGVKNCEKSKNRRKSLCAPLHIDSWAIWKKIQCSSLWPRMWMCTYIKIVSAHRYIVLTASIKICIGSPKTARNEQVCAHQKSYRK